MRVFPEFKDERGFTLFELIVAISVAAILVGIAIPSYRNLMLSNRLTTAANAFVAGVNVARLEAVRRNSATQFCAASNNGTDTLGVACGTAVGAVQATKSDGSATLVYEAPPVASDITVTSTVALRYGGQGLASAVGDTSPTYSGLLIDLSSSKLKTDNHRCVYVATGSNLRTCTYTSTSGGCPTNETSACK